ncbi:hypothetical protein LJR220_003327 [Bradyrhizobium sp. LjRoot220]|uniref:hypothetical protein n=1 Tax=Bradyrhizobium sp. LjRoot220 TaxID=3342284 RepID=UPI003ECD1CB6
MADGDSGFSQQDPADSATPYNAQTFVIRQLIAQISTLKIVKVLTVNTDAPGRGTVDVQPMVNQLDGENNATPHGTIFGIPYRSFQFGKNAVLADPVAGDMGVMACADRDISAVKSAKDIAPPGSGRQYDMADGVYLGGLLGDEEPEQYVKFTEDGMELADKNTNKLVSGPTGWEFTGPVKFNQLAVMAGGMQLSGNIVNVGGGAYTGNFITSGTIQSGTISLTGHHHTAQGAFAPTTASQP